MKTKLLLSSSLHPSHKKQKKSSSSLQEQHITMASYKSCHQSLKFVLLISSFVLYFSCVSVHALNVGVQTTGTGVSLMKECSRKCESEFCSVPPFLRYGKYCGLLYSGCPGERPCDGLDACCMKHDVCIQLKNNDYLSEECSQTFLNCMKNFKDSGGRTFKGNKCDVGEVVDIISLVIDAALLAGKVLHKP